MKPQTKHPWSRGAKTWLVVYSFAAALALGWFFRQRAINALPPMAAPHPMPAVNARDYYIAAAALVDKHKIDDVVLSRQTPVPGQSAGGFPGGPSSDGPPPALHVYSLSEKAQVVAENTRAIQLLHQGFQFPYQEPPGSQFTTSYPHYLDFRRLSRLLRLQAQVEAGHGQWNRSLDTSLDAIQLGETMPHGSPLLGVLVGVASQSDGRKYAWGVVNHLTAAEARAAARRLEAIRTAHVPFADTLRAEKWNMQAGLRDDMAKADWANQLLTETDVESPRLVEHPLAWAIRERKVFLLEALGKRKILLDNARWMDQVIAQARLPYAARPTPPPLPSDLINTELLFDYGNARFWAEESDTQNALLVTALALQAYSQDNKAYPASLTSLVPGYLKAVPIDPFALSGPLRYKTVGPKYLLYSVGPDSRDNGGAAIIDGGKFAPNTIKPSDRHRIVDRDSLGDIVAGVNT